ncbi:hypothetical protein GALMADRAFT_1069561 [Galerina marginata CBS 339.88]|uniref:Uncharacterized protein n=1 Tax=Galerina marginata (strain CBS 339.88) TaxID=685588 RepID=A0A067S9V3_GALM3|nr:hypothetical protein GALMADRAFT_1069561 [Galerina marginata CBS 339.88]
MHRKTILRSGNKYEIDHFRDEGLGRLKDAGPRQLRVFGTEIIPHNLEIGHALESMPTISIIWLPNLLLRRFYLAACALCSSHFSTVSLHSSYSSLASILSRERWPLVQSTMAIRRLNQIAPNIGSEMRLRKSQEIFKAWLQRAKLKEGIPGLS